jgi:isopenicillin N synthase-like dioxygenase
MEATDHNLSIPVIDVNPLLRGTENRRNVAAEIGRACRDCGFFYLTGHGVDERLQQQMEQLSRQFFAQDVEAKMEIRMARGGRAWRGYFPVGDELTSGQPDWKEGIYFGANSRMTTRWSERAPRCTARTSSLPPSLGSARLCWNTWLR